MRKIGLIIKREYLSRVAKKSFLLITFLVPLLLVGISALSILITLSSKEKTTIIVKDDSGYFMDVFNGYQDKDINFEVIDSITPLDSATARSNRSGHPLLYIPAINLRYPVGIMYFANKQPGFGTEDLITDLVSAEIRNRVLEEMAYDTELLAKLDKGITLEKRIGQQGSAGNAAVATAAGYAFGFLIYLYLIIYGSMVMKGVMEEKTNRIVEIMISSVRPFELMLGKIIGIGAVGLTQFILWIVLAAGLNAILGFFLADQIKEMATQPPETAGGIANAGAMVSMIIENLDLPRLIFSFVIYFLLGYLFYAAQFAAIGAASTDESETQTLTFPVTIPLILAFVIMAGSINNPHSSTAFWGSMVPFTSPVVMLSRIPFQVSWVEQIVSMLILLFSSLAMVWLAGRIYRTGILIQGKKVTFGELFKWLFYKG
jgi:ABC-2 type transport system permease protein